MKGEAKWPLEPLPMTVSLVWNPTYIKHHLWLKYPGFTGLFPRLEPPLICPSLVDHILLLPDMKCTLLLASVKTGVLNFWFYWTPTSSENSEQHSQQLLCLKIDKFLLFWQRGLKKKISIPNVSNGVVRPAVLFAYAPHRMQAMTAM